MKTFKVISPKGFSLGGQSLEKGDTFEAENKSAHVQTGLHFKQIQEETKPSPAKEPAKDAKPPK